MPPEFTQSIFPLRFSGSVLKKGEVKALRHPNDLHLQAAQGWLELGNHHEANEELEKISPAYRQHPDVLEVRWEIYAKDKRWDACLDIASALVKLAPDRALSWIHNSYSLHELNRTQEALDWLVEVEEDFPDNATIPYNLACYNSVLRNFEDAQFWFKRAMLLDDKVQNIALDDPDLKPLWDSMRHDYLEKGVKHLPDITLIMPNED